jgi:hypothetical protein
MPSVAVVAPIVLPLIAAAVIAAFGAAGVPLGRVAAGLGAWSSAAALLAVWLPVRSSLELILGALGYGSSLDLRLDAVSFAFGLMVVVPAAVLLTLQPRTWQESTLSMLGVAAAMAAVEAGGVVLTAIAGSTAATLAVVSLATEDPRAPRPSWALLLAGWLALVLVGVTLQVGGGTAVYSAVPVAAVTAPVFVVLASAALLVSSLFPWRAWPVALWSRPSLRAAGITIATLYPLGFYILVRAYELGAGRYPHIAFNVVLAVIGIAVALGAGARAQAAATRREFFGEVITGFGGFALSAIAIGTPLSLVAGIVMLATASAIVACLSLLPDRTGLAPLVTVAAAVGLPPGIAFGSRVIGIESAFEGGDFVGLIGLAGAAVWALWVVAGARAIGLPGGRGHPASETFPRVAMALAAATLIAGPALALLQLGFANPAAADVMPAAASSLAGGATSVVTTSTVLPAVTLFAPLLLIALLVYAGTGASAIHTQARPAILELPAAQVLQRIRSAAGSAVVPEQYRSILNLRELELAAAGGRPVLWLTALVALAFAVTR